MSDLATRILEYISTHPDTEDNIESVSKWWRDIQSLDPSVDRVTSTLEELVKEEKIVKVDFGQDIFIYNIR